MLDDLKKELIKVIDVFGPIKATELVVRLTPNMVANIDLEQIFTALDELVLEKEIIEVEYSLPNIKYRAKSIYFPKGTEIVVTGK